MVEMNKRARLNLNVVSVSRKKNVPLMITIPYKRKERRIDTT